MSAPTKFALPRLEIRQYVGGSLAAIFFDVINYLITPQWVAELRCVLVVVVVRRTMNDDEFDLRDGTDAGGRRVFIVGHYT